MGAPADAPAGTPVQTGRHPVWDPVVKLSHWFIALVVLANTALTEGGSTLHVAVGWLGMALLLMRLVWGLIGPGPARLSAFPPNPRAALSHIARLAAGRARDYPSHNPAGGLMIWTLWAALAVVIVTGLVMTDGRSPLQMAEDAAVIETGDWTTLGSDDEEERSAEWVQDVHETAANLMLLLALIHVGGVVVESLLQRRNLVLPMLPGRRR